MDVSANDLRLNLGCGRWVLDGWINIDAVAKPESGVTPQLVCDVKVIPLPDACAVEILAVHLWEHFYRWECEAVIAEWRRLLRPEGLLTMEMPDVRKCARNVLSGHESAKHPDQLGMWGLYGDPREQDPLMVHRWGWTFDTLWPFLKAHGFKDFRELQTKWHKNGRDVRDFRIEATRV
jgi:hypothetical protein